MEAAMILCPACGKENREGDRACSRCAKSLPMAPSTTSAPAATQHASELVLGPASAWPFVDTLALDSSLAAKRTKRGDVIGVVHGFQMRMETTYRPLFSQSINWI